MFLAPEEELRNAKKWQIHNPVKVHVLNVEVFHYSFRKYVCAKPYEIWIWKKQTICFKNAAESFFLLLTQYFIFLLFIIYYLQKNNRQNLLVRNKLLKLWGRL